MGPEARKIPRPEGCGGRRRVHSHPFGAEKESKDLRHMLHCRIVCLCNVTETIGGRE